MQKETKLRMAVNALLFAGVATGWFLMVFGGEGVLRSGGLEGLKYFTVLSNVLEGAAALVWMISVGATGRETRFVTVLKYIAAVCVGLTFVTVLVFFGPLYGYLSMYRSANFFFHLLVPLGAMVEFVLMNRETVSLRENLAAVAAPLLYGTVYTINVLVREPADNPFEHDFYGFLLWGLPVGIGIFAVICAATFLIGLALRKCNGMVWND